MREKYLWLIIGVLTAVTLGQACYIYQNRAEAIENSGPLPAPQDMHGGLYSEKAYDSQWEALEKWREKVQKQIERGDPLLERDFDIFFNDRFFAGRFSPFAEMERIRRELSGGFGRSERLLFDGYWDKWFEQRMRMGEFRTDVSRSGTHVTIGITIPGLSEDTLHIDISEGRIKVRFSAKKAAEESSASRIVKRGYYRSYMKVLPLPADAVPGTGKVSVEGDRVEIRFDLKTAPGAPR